MHTEQIFINKKIVLINELTRYEHQLVVNLVYLPQRRQLNLKKALEQINSYSLNLINCHLFYTDFNKRMNIFIGQYPFQNQHQIMLRNQLFLNGHIQIIYKQIQKINNHNKNINLSNQSTNKLNQKRRKVKQRTIKQAIQAVKKWRQLYEQSDEKGKRIYTLQTAAQKVGYAKKTLDDYFNQLKLAQNYNFDFNFHYYHKIGILRNFVKNKIDQEKASNSNNEKYQHNNQYQQQQIDQYLKDSISSDYDSIY